MSQIQMGEINWNDGDVNEGGTGKSDFMRLEANSKSRVRIMGNPVQYYVHWLDLPDGKKKKINCPVSDLALVKKLTDAGFKKQARWMIKVLDRTDGQFKILEIGSQIYSAVKNLVQDSDWGPITGYDVSIDRGSPGSQPLYRVTPRPKSALEAEYKSAFLAFNERVDLNKFIQPADPAEVRKEMGWDSSGSKPKVASESMSDDDDVFNFES